MDTLKGYIQDGIIILGLVAAMQTIRFLPDRLNAEPVASGALLLRKWGWRRFRHTLATEMMKSPDRNLAMVKGLLGHRSVRTTMEYVELDLKVTGQALEDEL